MSDGKIILEPVQEIPKQEQWLFDPKIKQLWLSSKKRLSKKMSYALHVLSGIQVEPL